MGAWEGGLEVGVEGAEGVVEGACGHARYRIHHNSIDEILLLGTLIGKRGMCAEL